VSMIDNEAKDHWRELAEQLGLPPEEQSQPKAPKGPVPEESPHAKPKAELVEPAFVPTSERQVADELVEPEEQGDQVFGKGLEDEADTSEPTSVAEFEQPKEEASDLPPSSLESFQTTEVDAAPEVLTRDDEKGQETRTEEEEPSRGRRRRGGRGGKR